MAADDSSDRDARHRQRMVRKKAVIDGMIAGPVLREMEMRGEDFAVMVLPDHPTPIPLRTHTAEPVPFLIYRPGIEPDEVQTYDEAACRAGSYGHLKGNEFINAFMND